MTWNALILTGSRQGPKDPIALASNSSHKALAPIAGKPMIDYVVDALGAIPNIDKIAVSIEPEATDLSGELIRLHAEPSPALSVLAGIKELGAPLLVTTADNPLINAQAVATFVQTVEDDQMDVAAGICPRHLVEQANNPARRTYLKFSDGAMSGCNLFAFRTNAGSNVANFWRSLETDRKKPWQMASKIGIGTLLKYVSGRLSYMDAGRAISQKTDCKAGLTLINDIYAAHDVDTLDDLAFVEQCLLNRQTKNAGK